MIVDAKQTTNVTVKIDPHVVVKNLFEEFKRSMPGEYINRDGEWVTWDDDYGRGSGITTKFRAATDEEKETFNSFITLLKYVSEKLIK